MYIYSSYVCTLAFLTVVPALTQGQDYNTFRHAFPSDAPSLVLWLCCVVRNGLDRDYIRDIYIYIYLYIYRHIYIYIYIYKC